MGWWKREIEVTKGTTRENPVTEVAKLTSGMIERCTIYFRPGAGGFVKVVLLHNERQFLPDDPNDAISGDDYVFDLPMNHELPEQPARIQVVAWNTATLYDHTILVGLFVNERPQMTRSEALLKLFGME